MEPKTTNSNGQVTALPGSRDYVQQAESIIASQPVPAPTTPPLAPPVTVYQNVPATAGPVAVPPPVGENVSQPGKSKKLVNIGIYLAVIVLVLGGAGVWFKVIKDRGFFPPGIDTNLPFAAKVNTNPKIILSIPKKEFEVGETIPVTIKIDTAQSNTIAADVILNYDPKMVSTITPLISQNFRKGDIYSDYPSISNNPSTGIFQASAINSLGGQGFKGEGDFGVLNLKANAPGTATIKVDFQKGAKGDSNLLGEADSVDILEMVEDLTITIR